MVRRFSWNVFAICIVLILSLTLSTVSPILYFVIGNKQEEQISTAPNWFDGKGLPSSAMGSDGDYYLDTLNGNVYQKKDSVWEVIYGIGKGDKGEQGPAGKDGNAVKTGTGDPNTSHVKGSTGDLYLDTQSGDLYEMQASGNWLYEANIKGSKGDKGQDGATWQVGDKDPRQSQSGVEGKEGDFYLNSSTWDLYKKTASGWSWVGNIQGEVGKQGLSGKDGATWIVGTDDPDGKVKGNSGDLYLNTLTYEVYKCSGETSWSSVGNIKGIAGPKGDDGQDGKDGTKWYFGNGTPQSQPSLSDVNEGDFYLDQTGMHIYRYESSEWQDKGAIRGEDGEDGQAGKDGSKWTSGTGSPNGRDTGSEGDFYLDSESGTVYKCNGGTVWEESGTIKGKDGENGQNGKDGTKWYFDKGSPEDKELSPNEGDYYLDETNFEIYRYEGSSWKDVGSIKGTQGEQGPSGAQGDKGKDGATWQVGTSDPTQPESGVSGKVGDLYLNTNDWNVYRCTDDENNWGIVGSIIGKTGERGPAGEKGDRGATWFFGEGKPDEKELPDKKNGDFYLDTKDDCFDVWKYDADQWTRVGSIKGAQGDPGTQGTPGTDGATWQVGTQNPLNDEIANSKEGDFYLNTNDWNLYRKGSDGWKFVVCIKGKDGENGQDGTPGTQGPAGQDGKPGQNGKDGATWYVESGDPRGEKQANEGDFYLNIDDGKIYKNTDGETGWQEVGSLKGKEGEQGTPGKDGVAGATWHVGEGDPNTHVTGAVGDFYLDTQTRKIYKNTNGDTSWSEAGELTVKDGVDGQDGKDGTKWYFGNGTPQSQSSLSDVKEGDFYLDQTGMHIYRYESSQWQDKGAIKGEDGEDGQAGKDGSKWTSGTGSPNGRDSGSEGDFYLDSESGTVYECKGGTDWKESGTIKGKDGTNGENGKDGATWFFGEGKPDEKELPDKKNGDFYLDTKDDCFDVWKYETEQWTRVGSIKGAQGDPGTPGTPGTDGATWQVGTQNPLNDEIANSKEGDFYLNTNDWNLYRKGSSGWTFVVCIKGQDGEDGQKGDDGQAGKDADDVYMGYDGYIWRGAERSDWYIPGATAGEDVFEHTTEVAEVMSKYFTHDYVDLSTNVIALMPYYKEHVDQTLYSGMELTEITVYAKEEGKLQIGSAKVKDVIDSRTNGAALLVINEQDLTVSKGKNIIKHTLHIDDDETIVLGGNGSVSLYYAKDIPVDDEPGNFALIDKQPHAELLEKTGTEFNDTLAIQVRMSLTVDVPMFEDLRQHVEEDIEGGLDGLESPVRFGDEHWGAYMYAYTGQNTNLFEGKTITRIGVPLEELNRSEGGGLPYLDMYLIPTYKDENGVTPDPDSKDVIAKRKEHSILTNNILTDRLEIKSESEYQAEQKELEKGATWVDFDCRYVVPDGYTLAFCGDGGGFKWLLVHSNGSDSEVEKLGLNKIPYYTPMNTIIGLGKNKDSGSSDYTKYSGNTETFKLLFDIYYEVEWSPAEQIARLEELEWEATEMDRLRSKVGDKYISILGDSISTYDDYSNDYTTQNKDIKNNNGGEGNATAYPRLAEISVEDTWWKRTINQAGLKLCVNNSSAGDLVLEEGSRIGYNSGRSAQLHDNTTKHDSDPTIASKNQDQEEEIYPDIVAIYFGINDFTNHIADEDGGVKEFETNYKLIVNKIMDTYGSRKEDFKLFVFTLFPEEGISEGNHHFTLEKFPDEENYQAALDKYNTVIRSIALDNRKIEVVDLSRKYHLSRDEFKPYALQDSLHPNERGMRLMSNAFLEELYRVYVGK